MDLRVTGVLGQEIASRTQNTLFIRLHSQGSGPAELTLRKGHGDQKPGFPSTVAAATSIHA